MFENPLSLIDISNQTTPTQLNELHTANTTRPRKVPIASRRTAQRYFQGRMDGLDVAVRESINDGLRNNNKIAPIVVFGSADEPVVVDGHHRLAALRGWFHDKPNKTTNVVWVDGDIEDAMYQTFSLNQATSKAYSQKDRMQQGWRSLCISAAKARKSSTPGASQITGSWVKRSPRSRAMRSSLGSDVSWSENAR